MGLAATQVRLLQLTSRQHRIEYQAQRIQAQKLQLSNESDRVYNEYMAALDAKKVQYKYVQTDGSVIYKDATFNNMFGGYNPDDSIQALYALEIVNGENAGKFMVSSDIKKAFDNHKDDIDEFVKKASNNSSDANEIAYYTDLYNLLTTTRGEELIEMNQAYGDSSEWLTNMLANGDVLLHKWDSEAGDDGEGEWTEVTVSTDSMLQEISDDKELKKAEATYEAENTRINKKDSQYDTLLSQTETERNAIKTEMDSLKQVRNDNIEKAFKCFS